MPHFTDPYLVVDFQPTPRGMNRANRDKRRAERDRMAQRLKAAGIYQMSRRYPAGQQPQADAWAAKMNAAIKGMRLRYHRRARASETFGLVL